MNNYFNLHNQNNNMKNEDKENYFVRFVRIFLAKPLFDFLFDTEKNKNDNNILFLNKNVTNIFIPLFIKNKKINIDVAIKWSDQKRNFVKHLLINDGIDFNNILSFTNLNQVTFNHKFNHPLITGVLPTTLSQLTFGHKFNHPLISGVLPTTLSQLTFGHEFNQPLTSGVLPTTLSQLTFGSNFNQQLTCGILPSTLSQVTFGWYFNQPLTSGVLPTN